MNNMVITYKLPDKPVWTVSIVTNSWDTVTVIAAFVNISQAAAYAYRTGITCRIDCVDRGHVSVKNVKIIEKDDFQYGF